MKKTNKKIITISLFVLLACVVLTSLIYLFDGISLNGLPNVKDIAYVEIKNTNISDDIKKLTSPGDIEKARNMANLLNYNLGTAKSGDAFIYMKFNDYPVFPLIYGRFQRIAG